MAASSEGDLGSGMWMLCASGVRSGCPERARVDRQPVAMSPLGGIVQGTPTSSVVSRRPLTTQLMRPCSRIADKPFGRLSRELNPLFLPPPPALARLRAHPHRQRPALPSETAWAPGGATNIARLLAFVVRRHPPRATRRGSRVHIRMQTWARHVGGTAVSPIPALTCWTQASVSAVMGDPSLREAEE